MNPPKFISTCVVVVSYAQEEGESASECFISIPATGLAATHPFRWIPTNARAYDANIVSTQDLCLTLRHVHDSEAA